MDFSKLTKEEIIDGIRNNETYLINLSDEVKDDEDIVLEAVKQQGWTLFHGSERLKDNKYIVLIAVNQNGSSLSYASERLQNDKDLLEVLEKTNTTMWNSIYKKYYKERMEFLNNIRRKEEKEFMENSIESSNKTSKKVKF